jgi:hypothetical protein
MDDEGLRDQRETPADRAPWRAEIPRAALAFIERSGVPGASAQILRRLEGCRASTEAEVRQTGDMWRGLLVCVRSLRLH